jgi:hypothetical protein
MKEVGFQVGVDFAGGVVVVAHSQILPDCARIDKCSVPVFRGWKEWGGGGSVRGVICGPGLCGRNPSRIRSGFVPGFSRIHAHLWPLSGAFHGP